MSTRLWRRDGGWSSRRWCRRQCLRRDSGRRGHGDIVAGDVDAEAQALGIDIGEVAAGLVGVFVGDVEIDMVGAGLLHLAVDGAGHDVARGEAQARIVFVHELLAGKIA